MSNAEGRREFTALLYKLHEVSYFIYPRISNYSQWPPACDGQGHDSVDFTATYEVRKKC